MERHATWPVEGPQHDGTPLFTDVDGAEESQASGHRGTTPGPAPATEGATADEGAPAAPRSAGPDAEERRGGPVTARGITRRLLTLGRTVATAPTRGRAESLLCEELVDAGLYRSAWVGVRATGTTDLVVRAGHVDDEERAGVDPVSERRLDVDTHGCPDDALETDDLQVRSARAVDPDAWPVPDSRLDEGVVAFVPLSGMDGVDGVVAVHTTRSNGIGELESAGLDALGTMLGVATDAWRSRELLFAESAVRIEVRLTDAGSLLVRLADDRDCRVTLDDYATGDGRWHLTCDVLGAGAESFLAAARAEEVVQSAAAVVDRTDGCRVDLVVTENRLLERALAAGATVSRAVADSGACEVGLDLPPSGNVPETVSQLRVAFPDLDFLTRCGTDDEPVVPAGSAGMLEDLTERQREVLTVAHRSGYFDWPRQHTAEEIADELGITSPTFHWHLRHAEHALVDSVVD